MQDLGQHSLAQMSQPHWRNRFLLDVSLDSELCPPVLGQPREALDLPPRLLRPLKS
jgi:hypothetical protein